MPHTDSNHMLPRGGLGQRTLLSAVVILAVVALSVHAIAVSSYRASIGNGPISQRAESAQTAARLEPFRREFAAHAKHLTLWARGADLLKAGDYNRAVATLNQALRTGPDEPGLVALYREASRVQSIETVKKAHLQHGHEGPGGTLAPEDIER